MQKNKPSKEVYAWDTTIFIAWLTAESTAPLSDIELVASEIERNTSCVLLMSVATKVELLDFKLGDNAMRALSGFVRRERVSMVNIDDNVAERAAQIRSDALAAGRKVKSMDAIIMATAINYRANVLHSLDPDMLKLNGLPIVEKLKIVKPMLLTGTRSVLGNP